ncbi:MAG: BREX system ATP-binding domain-containing protein [Longimicrobiaceae bacterium]
MIRPQDYLAFVGEEYLADFVRAGGAAVKFAVLLEGASAEELRAGLRDAAAAAGYAYARVDAAEVKVHMIDRVFHTVARQIDWDGLARFKVARLLEELRFVLPEDASEFTLTAIARLNDYDEHELRRDVNRRLQEEVFHDYEMAQEFRIAMIRLCQAQLDPSPAARAERDDVIAWLTGELRRISVLKQALIFQKIARHNARHMLFSLARWLTRTGRSGLVLDLDIRRCTEARRPAPEEGLYYSRPAVMDAYEVLRQLIDATDELSACFTLVTCAPEFLSDPSRGLDAYHALKLRIWDEVHDRRRANPLSALLRMSPTAPPWTAA